jgi:CheY-like chemotaxis protein
MAEGAPDVLVVDDDADLRRLIAEALADEDIPYRVARDGAEAVARVAEQVPAVILLDMMMPRLDGAGVCDKLDEHGTRPPPAVVVMTANDRVSYFERRCGAEDVLSKPFDLEALYAVVRRYLRRYG